MKHLNRALTSTALLVLLASGGCAAKRLPLITTLDGPVPFRATMDASGPVAGELAGKVVLVDGALEVHVEEASFEPNPFGGPTWRDTDFVAAGLAHWDTWRCRLGSTSERKELRPLLDDTGRVLARPTVFRIPVPAGLDLRPRWIAFAFIDADATTPSGMTVTSYLYAWSDRHLFDPEAVAAPDAARYPCR